MYIARGGDKAEGAGPGGCFVRQLLSDQVETTNAGEAILESPMPPMESDAGPLQAAPPTDGSDNRALLIRVFYPGYQALADLYYSYNLSC